MFGTGSVRYIITLSVGSYPIEKRAGSGEANFDSWDEGLGETAKLGISLFWFNNGDATCGDATCRIVIRWKAPEFD